MKNPVNVILIEDNPEYRYAIELSLKNDPAITLSKQFGTAELALRELEPSYSSHQAPDLILLDLNLPGMSGHEAILNVMQGGGALDPKVIPTVLEKMGSHTDSDAADISLTPREHEILSLLAEGLQKKEIANNLQIGLETVSTHIKNTYLKLEVANAPAAISKAYQTGILKAK